MKNKLLIVSRRENNKFKKNFKKIYAGNWCLENQIKKNPNVFDWGLNNNFKKNYRYLSKIIEKYKFLLSKELNQIHNVNKNIKFWEILLFPWITYYIPAQFYRWKIINDIIKNNKNLYFTKISLKNYRPLTESLEFLHAITNSEYLNDIFFSRILDHFSKKKKNLYSLLNKDNYKIYDDIKRYKNTKKINKKFNFKDFFSSKINKIQLKKKIFIFEGMFSTKDFIKLNLSINQIPSFSKKIFDKEAYLKKITNLKVNKLTRKRVLLNKNNDCFQNYLNKYLINDLPMYLIEGFKLLNDKSDKINLKSKYVLVFHDHYHNELFKFWLANNIKKIKLLISAHGASIQAMPAHFGIESKIPNNKICFVNDDESSIKKIIKLPYPKTIRLKRKKPKLLLYNCYAPEYYPCRYGISNNAYILNRNYQDLKFLEKYLDKKIYSKFYISNRYNHNDKSVKNINQFIKRKKVFRNISFRKQLDNSKLVICTHPQTTFLESIASGPTIGLFNYEDWLPTKENLKIYKKLKENNIFFEDTIELAKFINKKWNNIDLWWNDLKKKKLIDEYIELFQKEKNYLKDWKNYLRKITKDI